MKVKIIKNFHDLIGGVVEGQVCEVIRKKLPDKWCNYTRYLVLVNETTNRSINVPEEFVEEIKE